MSSLQALILGILQGVTEFLPISSSGHLVLGKHLLGLRTEGATMEIFLHLGTLLAILLVFRAKLGKIILSLFRGRILLVRGEGVKFTDQELRFLLLLVLGSIPSGVIGLLFARRIGMLFNSALFVSFAIISTGTFLHLTKFRASNGRQLKVLDCLVVGLAQAIAILPGISRSGATVGTGLLLGIDRKSAVEYSFLLGVPAILGATGLELREAWACGAWGGNALPLCIGVVSAFAVGYLALRLLMGAVRRGKLSVFSYYCWAVGILGFILSLR